jgi:hypothetical protein
VVAGESGVTLGTLQSPLQNCGQFICWFDGQIFFNGQVFDLPGLLVGSTTEVFFSGTPTGVVTEGLNALLSPGGTKIHFIVSGNEVQCLRVEPLGSLPLVYPC